MGQMKNTFNILEGKPEGKGLMRGGECNNIGTDLREICWEGRKWIHLTQNMDQSPAVVNTVTNLQVPWKAANF
jgi:hypothetical protein